jgi:hypothetical protein
MFLKTGEQGLFSPFEKKVRRIRIRLSTKKQASDWKGL